MELSTFRHRPQEGLSKAARGEMYHSVAAGYIRDGSGVEKDLTSGCDKQLIYIFRKFAE